MMGYEGQDRGITPRLCEALFEEIDLREEGTADLQCSHGTRKKVTHSVTISFLEIYNEKVLDLLAHRRRGHSHDQALPVMTDPVLGPVVKGLSLIRVNTWEEVEANFDRGQENRSTAATAMNDRSSRSHAVVQLNLLQTETVGVVAGKELNKDRRSRMNLVDLAGSEKVAKSKVVGANLKEAIGINQSLTCLGRVIDHLIEFKPHIPYRDSMLTSLLSDSLGGNSRTTMLAALSPAAINFEETLSTLRYASRARKIVNVVKVNEDPSAALIRELQEELAKMKEAGGGISGSPAGQSNALETEQLIMALQQRENEEQLKMSEREVQWAEEKQAVEQAHSKELENMKVTQYELLEQQQALKERHNELQEDVQGRRRAAVLEKFGYAARISAAQTQAGTGGGAAGQTEAGTGGGKVPIRLQEGA
eukprot:NODE_953_length_1746_cov_2.918468_g893_i0.p1 GENE.NODE_953_length_1746_cov_2.918468_g893_i0~~NODE_953_length_1746_cov_2.918468_g893_i0.p1  ORF type:complete len:421 (+),score=126.46 NODE_953_length_1746_cov_2.918468_g893_i0:372-1634(+)